MNVLSIIVAVLDWVQNVTTQMVPTVVDALYLDTNWMERTVKVKCTTTSGSLGGWDISNISVDRAKIISATSSFLFEGY